MRVLITAGPTQEPIDAVRYIGNRSSGKMGAALAAAAKRAGHSVTVIHGPVSVAFPPALPRIGVESSAQMLGAVLAQFPHHDLLIMAAAVADFRPKSATDAKLSRQGTMVLELEPTTDIVAEAGKIKRPNQRTIGFSLEAVPDLDRARRKLIEKRLDLIVFNPVQTIGSDTIGATLIFPDGRSEQLPPSSKTDMADILLQHAAALFSAPHR
jgi:phosphopantothenoylcysteine decarboxylase/phosphopantothenate--cysteine ligase